MDIIDHAIAVLESVATSAEILQEYNPNHDARGRFAHGAGMGEMGMDIGGGAGLPQLEGSAKQVDWANGIRAQKIDRVNNPPPAIVNAARSKIMGLEAEYNDALNSAPSAVQDSHWESKLAQIKSSALSRIRQERSAKWFIDNRDKSEIMRSADEMYRSLLAIYEP